MSTLSKITSGFLSLFMIQCMLVPNFITQTNFEGIKLDDYHVFLMRVFGILGCGLCYLWYQMDASMIKFQTIVIVLFGLAGPVYAQFYMPVKLPDHYLPFVGFTGLMAYHLFKLFEEAKGANGKKD